MRRIRILVAAIALSASVAMPARAAHYGGSCGGVWTSGTSCLFYFRGLPVTVSAEAFTSSGTAQVHAWITLEIVTGGPTYTIVECSDSRARHATCDAALDVGNQYDSTKQLFLITCNVEGKANGTYGCISALGI